MRHTVAWLKVWHILIQLNTSAPGYLSYIICSLSPSQVSWMSLIHIVYSYKCVSFGRTKQNVKGKNCLKQTMHVKYTKMRRDHIAERGSERMDKESKSHCTKLSDWDGPWVHVDLYSTCDWPLPSFQHDHWESLFPSILLS